MKLTKDDCRLAEAIERPYKLADGGGLYLLVKPNGSKHWRLKYRFLGKEKLLALGPSIIEIVFHGLFTAVIFKSFDYIRINFILNSATIVSEQSRAEMGLI